MKIHTIIIAHARDATNHFVYICLEKEATISSHASKLQIRKDITTLYNVVIFSKNVLRCMFKLKYQCISYDKKSKTKRR
jgi:hypothetical protein